MFKDIFQELKNEFTCVMNEVKSLGDLNGAVQKNQNPFEFDKNSSQPRYAVKEKTQSKPKEQNHSHPSEKHSKIEEKKPIYGSLGEVNDEGCVEHNDLRFVQTSLPTEEKQRNDKLREYMIFSEILGKPKCKR